MQNLPELVLRVRYAFVVFFVALNPPTLHEHMHPTVDLVFIGIEINSRKAPDVLLERPVFGRRWIFSLLHGITSVDIVKNRFSSGHSHAATWI
jgi:hypothetical protein